MDGTYDEIISDNPFYLQLKNEYNSLYQHCITESWIICIPRIGSLTTRAFTVEDFCAHILVPSDELPQTHYSTLTEKQVTVFNKVICLDVTNGLPLQSHILFEETFYTEDHLKFIVWCIETPLEPYTNKEEIAICTDNLSSINDCINLLWTQAAGRQVLDQIEINVQQYFRKNPNISIALGPLKDSISELYTQCLQVTLKNKRLRERSKTCKQMLNNIKVAVESYMQHLMFDKVFGSICTCSAYEDSHLNKKIRNLSDIQLRDLDIRKDLYHAVPQAKQILSKINNYSTILEKVICIKKALNSINKTDNFNNKITYLTADDMLPVFVFLIIKSDLPNWFSQLTYMKEFRFSSIGNGNGDECSFLITTLEAVIQHIQSDALVGPVNPESYYYESDLTEDRMKALETKRSSLTESVSTSGTSSGEETLDQVFEMIKNSQREEICIIFERNQKNLIRIQQNGNNILDSLEVSQDDEEESDQINTEMCHPLCNCKRCNKRIFKGLLKTSPTIKSRDSHGLTALHVACIHGKANIVESLIEIGADVNASDLNESTPLHYAASRGHQNALLLLIHYGANLNCTNIDKNTPLHLSVNNGHMSCVKALIYYAEHSRKYLKINCFNSNRNTPLHMASKWGYEGIAKLLIENGAEPSLQNKYNKTAFDYAHNLRILHILKMCTPDLFEFIHISDADIEMLNIKSNSMKDSSAELTTNDNSGACKVVENLKRMDRILKAISYGDVKLACFYMNFDYMTIDKNIVHNNKTSCHPLCECQVPNVTTEHVGDFDVNFSDTQGQTALHCAARHGLVEMCNILISNKANVDCKNKRGETPLHLAALYNKTIAMNIFIKSGCNINAMDLSGNTALHNASQMGNIGATKILINCNPDITINNGSGKTALGIARDKVHLTIIDLIEKYAIILNNNLCD